MAARIYMPFRGERASPKFDRTKPRELNRFFKDLEKLFARVGVVTDAEKKDYVLDYVEFEVEEIWRTFPEYASATATYIAFRDVILQHYPDATGDYVYSLRDMDSLIGNAQRDGINTANDLQEFHLSFVTITSWLVEKNQISDFEQRRGYLRAFQPSLLAAITNRLQMLFLHQHPNIPHTVKDIYEAARYVLQSVVGVQRTHIATTTTTSSLAVAASSPVVSPDINIKAETFAATMATFGKTIADALQQTNRSRVAGPSANTSRNTDCNFCGGPHYIKDCPIVDEYVTAGKVRRNFEGKVVLSSGAFVPRDIPGTLLRERVDEWHHRNPNQLSVATLLHTISTEHIRQNTQPPPRPVFELSIDDQIAAVEAELFQLRSRRPTFTPAIRTRAQRAREPAPEASIEEVDDVPVILKPAKTPAKPVAPIVPVVPEITAAKEAIVVVPEIVISAPIIAPELPFASAKDAAYAPPTARNVGAPVKIPPIKAAVPAYRTLPPIHDAAIAVDVYKRSLETPVTLTQRELLALSPEVRTRYRDDTTTRRIPIPPEPQPAFLFVDEEDDPSIEPSYSFALQDKRLPEGAIIVPDPIEAYYKSLAVGEAPDITRLTVAKESTAIRSIFALIDNFQKKECTVDPGCQVIAMSETTCHSLTLAYDPQIRLNMESANGSFDWSLGLSRNVPFLIGTITLYLQVHVIRSPSYEILLGRPFDVLTESVIRNYRNEDQTITITDPNTMKKITIPTFARGSHGITESQPDFLARG